MKIIYLPLFLCAFSFTCAAQDMSMPAGAPAPKNEAPALLPQNAEYNTPSQSYKAERNAIRRGNKYYKDKKYHEALEQYNKALEVNSGSVRGRFNYAMTLLNLQSDDNKGTAKDPRAAAAQILQSLVNDAKQYDREVAERIFYALGNMSFNDQQYDPAIEMYKAALRIDPQDIQARENLRLAQLKKQEQENKQDQQDQDKKDQDKQDQQQQQQQDQQQQQQDQQQQQQQQAPQPQKMTQSAQQILQSMQNKENQTRKKVKDGEPQAGRALPEKPW